MDRLPGSLPDEEKCQIARKVVIAGQQWITYQEFLPAMGVRLAPAGQRVRRAPARHLEEAVGALRDGDRFFYGNDSALRVIRRTLGEVVAANTDERRGDLAYNVFRTHPPVG